MPLRGKSATELARLILVCRGGRTFAKRFVLQGMFGRRAGGGGELRRRAFHGATGFPLPSRRGNGGLCPHPLKGSIP